MASPQPFLASAPEALPEKFGRYRVMHPLGAGPRGAVYVAYDTQGDRRVILKVPRLDEGGTGQLKIELRPTDAPGQALLRVSDNGRGLPPDFERRKAESLGMQMVSDLVLQVGGTLTVGPPPQAVFAIVFVPEGDASA